MKSFNSSDLIVLFNTLFEFSEQTVLVGGSEEPLYLPQQVDSGVNTIFFTRDYFASALHEVAHWCIAGKARRQLVDYGYWYRPDGRSLAEQQLFQAAEVKPQALEWIFAQAAGSTFCISLDNLSGTTNESTDFKLMLHQQALYYLNDNLPRRAALFKASLLKFYQRETVFDRSLFCLTSL